MSPTLHAQILTLKKYQAWRKGEDTRTMDEAGIKPAAVTSALNAVIAIAENHLRDGVKKAEAVGRLCDLAHEAVEVLDGLSDDPGVQSLSLRLSKAAADAGQPANNLSDDSGYGAEGRLLLGGNRILEEWKKS
ncbi:hypothetical protein [Pusillimonas minor]|uniref:Uncharacterized protein n=1 Tax=Pusillimonas minor TaxID=2697024 RepID=A0A842HIX0_9BURK|nr:hypothetical protein [Pusillimonas minor]MBC2768599.1 hypothetical protein [Pusillimonas minor]